MSARLLSRCLAPAALLAAGLLRSDCRCPRGESEYGSPPVAFPPRNGGYRSCPRACSPAAWPRPRCWRLGCSDLIAVARVGKVSMVARRSLFPHGTEGIVHVRALALPLPGPGRAAGGWAAPI